MPSPRRMPLTDLWCHPCPPSRSPPVWRCVKSSSSVIALATPPHLDETRTCMNRAPEAVSRAPLYLQYCTLGTTADGFCFLQFSSQYGGTEGSVTPGFSCSMTSWHVFCTSTVYYTRLHWQTVPCITHFTLPKVLKSSESTGAGA